MITQEMIDNLKNMRRPYGEWTQEEKDAAAYIGQEHLRWVKYDESEILRVLKIEPLYSNLCYYLDHDYQLPKETKPGEYLVIELEPGDKHFLVDLPEWHPSGGIARVPMERWWRADGCFAGVQYEGQESISWIHSPGCIDGIGLWSSIQNAANETPAIPIRVRFYRRPDTNK